MTDHEVMAIPGVGVISGASFDRQQHQISFSTNLLGCVGYLCKCGYGEWDSNFGVIGGNLQHQLILEHVASYE